MQPTDVEMANALRMLAVDAVQAANSGHPGAPLGMADLAQVLWHKHLRHSPNHPHWPNRDRFVLSNGHASMLLYGLLHLSGYELSLEELKNFRQLHSKTAGHPEFGLCPGVETTTGPLGQGFANAVGMAIAQKLLAGEFNRPGFPIVQNRTYVLLGDGCMMEGISHEAASLAGTLHLGNLVAIYDDNGISIDGEVVHWFTDDTALRFEAYGWHVIRDIDGHFAQAVDIALEEASHQRSKPTLICCKTVIGKGSPNKAGTHDVHGAPLGSDEIAKVRETLHWDSAAFVIPEAIAKAWDHREVGNALYKTWQDLYQSYAEHYPELASEFERRIQGKMPADWADTAYKLLLDKQHEAKTVATRKASQMAIEAIAPHLPELLGGSADLTSSNLTNWSNCRPVRALQYADRRTALRGNYINYGVREFGMSAIMNGLVLYGGFLPFGGTFLTFSDYSRNAIRMAALMKQRVLFVFTHDSIGLGEDGPTHQPIEHISSLRLIPNLQVWRPCDTVETMAAWIASVERHDGPSCLVLSRQNLPHQTRSVNQVEQIRQGGYVLSATTEKLQAVLIATGSEVALAMAAQTELAKQGIGVNVVSMPCTQIFDKQPRAYRETVLPPGVARIAIEAGVEEFWHKYVGLEQHGGRVVGINTFGESAPADQLFKHFGFTVEQVLRTVREAVRLNLASN